MAIGHAHREQRSVDLRRAVEGATPPAGEPEAAVSEVQSVVSDPGRLGALRRWDRSVCTEFVDAHYIEIFRFFLWLSSCREKAEDLTQETFAEFWSSLERSGPASFEGLRPWLFAVARNRWRKECRDAPPPAGRLDEAAEMVEDHADPSERCCVALDLARVQAALLELPPDLREALILRVFQEFSYEEIGEVAGITCGLARWRVCRARKLLRRALEQEENGGLGSGTERHTVERGETNHVG